MRRTKIVCTLGPTSGNREQIEELVKRGMNVARINLSHGEREQHKKTVSLLKEINKDIVKKGLAHSPIAILLDTKGAEVRTSVVETPIEIHRGDEVIFSSKPVSNANGKVVIVDHDGFSKDVKDAEYILIDNGKIFFDIVSIEKDGTVKAKARQEGSIGSRRHVNLPGANLDMPSITEKDWDDIAFGAEEDVDFIALSFVRKASEVKEIRAFLKKKKSGVQLISKIETRQAVKDIEAIVEASDGIMVARGDLGAEVPFETVPVIQDDIVARCLDAGKPVIVATDMLDSMIEQPMPTRAEVTDIAHAATTGTDATMLSGETANGKFPLESIEAMVRVLCATEEHIASMKNPPAGSVHSDREAQAFSAVSLAASSGVSAIIVLTRGGRTGRDIAKFRSQLPVIAFTPEESVQHSLQLCYGVLPLQIAFDTDPEKTVLAALQKTKDLGLAKKGESVVLISDAKAHEQSVSTIQTRIIP
jgi:pyruvate kinase